MGSLEAIRGTVHSAHGKPLQIAGRTQHLDIQWGEARGRASLISIVGLESPPCLIGMDIMRPLRVHIDVTNGTATPAQPDPQTVHLNAAQSQQQRKEMSLPRAGLRSPQTADSTSNSVTMEGKPVARSWLANHGNRLSASNFAATGGNTVAENSPLTHGSR